MNREIKFRAWLEGTHGNITFQKGSMDYGITISEKGFYCDIESGWDIQGTIETVPIMQFTGLKDKNGKEIFEGDVLFNSNRTLITSIEDKRLYLVKWQNPTYNEENTWLQKTPSFILEKIVYNNIRYMTLIFNQSQIEIIGNIYENPELLDGSAVE
jgi:uncharacterized phage protein (TIGR01671 family)